MKKILRTALNLLSDRTRIQLYRKMTVVPDDYYNPDVSVEIARTSADLERAYALLHDCYVGIRILDPQPSGLRCNLFSFLPTSTIIVAKLKGEVIGTVCAIRDSRSGLPSDKEFLKENTELRRQGKVLVEASALAVAKEHRGQHSVSFLLMKYIYFYCRHSFSADHMVCAVHPRAEDFYKAIWQFEKNGTPLQYGSLKGAAAIHLSLDLSQMHFEKIVKAFGADRGPKNFASILQTGDLRFHYPPKQSGQNITPVITPEILKYFCLKFPEIWSSMSHRDQETLLQVYSTYFGSESVRELPRQPFRGPRWSEQEYRTQVQLPVVVRSNQDFYFCEMLDLTSGGCYISTEGAIPMAGDHIRLSFHFEGRRFLTEAEVIWRNEGQNLAHRRRGFGVRFKTQVLPLKTQLQDWLYRPAQSIGVKATA